METLYLPALRAKMGDWIYYITFMKLRFVAERVKAAEEVHKSKALKELIQRELDRSKHAKQIKNYLLTDKQRFFNSLVIGIYRGAPEWYELEVNASESVQLDTLPRYLDGAFGILALSGEEKLFAIDGQHRVVGIKDALTAKRTLGNEEVSAIFVSHKEDTAGRERTRRLFTRLNRFAKPVRKEEIIALDEDDVIAILTREFVDDDLKFRDKISTKKTKALPSTDKRSFTTISTMYDSLDFFLKTGTPQSWSDFKRSRPSESEIRKFRARGSSLWRALAKQFPEVRKVLQNPPGSAEKYRHSAGGHLLFRPVGLLMAIKVISGFQNKGLTLAQALVQLGKVPMELSGEPWIGLLWDRINQRMITQPENQKAAHKLLYHAAGGDLSDLNTDSTALIKELAGLLNREMSEVNLPVY